MERYFNLIAAIFIFCFCKVYSHGNDCKVENMKAKKDFDPMKFQGRWYEIKWILSPWIPAEWNYQDYVVNFNVHDKGYKMDIYGRWPADAPNCSENTALLYKTETRGRYLFERSYPNKTEFNSTYWISDTDYDNYAITLGCRHVNSSGQCTEQDAWLWSRTQKADPALVKRMEDQFLSLCLTTDQFITTNHNRECPTSSAASTVTTVILFLTLIAMFLRGIL